MQLWAIGYSGDESTVDQFAKGSEAACLCDAYAAFSAFGASKDDLFVIDAAGIIRHRLNLGIQPLSSGNTRQQLDDWVRVLLD